MTYTLYFGRFQPFTKDHEKVLQALLDEGKNVLVAIQPVMGPGDRATCVERMDVIHQKFISKYGARVQITYLAHFVEEVVLE